MRLITLVPCLPACGSCSPAALIGGLLAGQAPADTPEAPAPRPIDARFAPYAPDPDHPWNRLHQALFVRDAADGGRRVHSTDPLLYRGGTFLLEGEPHRRAVALLDQFLAGPGDRRSTTRSSGSSSSATCGRPSTTPPGTPTTGSSSRGTSRRPSPSATGWPRRSAGWPSPTARLAALPDNYALAVKSKQYPAAPRPEAPRAAVPPAGPLRPGRPVGPVPRGDRQPMARAALRRGRGPGRARHLPPPAGRAGGDRAVPEGIEPRRAAPGTVRP